MGVKTNWPTAVVMAFQTLLGLLAVFHKVTAEQLAAVNLLFVPWTAFVHGLTKDSSSGGPPSAPTRTLGALVFGYGWALCAVFSVSSCSRAYHVAEPTVDGAITDVCSALASENHAALEAEAVGRSVPLDTVLTLFRESCALRVRAGLEPTQVAALAAARGETPP